MTTQTRIEIRGADAARFDEILTPDALTFVTRLHDAFAHRRQERLHARMERRLAVENGRDLRFLAATAPIRADDTWRVAGAGPGLEDRRVEITGPVDRESAVRALNSGAKAWGADLEDATSPTWSNIVDGQLTLFDAVRRQLEFVDEDGLVQRLRTGELPTIVMRPRGWHLVEKHLRFVDRTGQRQAASASLVDFGLYLFHNAQKLIDSGKGPYFYLPKIEDHLEARLWDDIFTFSENALGLHPGTIRATVLIETISAAFEMEEILYELRDHCAGLNAGRWDYIFSFIKSYRDRGPQFVFPDRDHITMEVPFMRSYTELLVATCHKRGAYAIGGMSTFVPDASKPELTEAALARVSEDKRREVQDGFDGTWVANPALVLTARAEFDEVLGTHPNQIDRLRPEVEVKAEQLLDVRSLDKLVTDAGVSSNISVALRYIESWLRGIGAVELENIVADASAAEISRAQLWQWIHYSVVTAEGTRITTESVLAELDEQVRSAERFDGDQFDTAADLVRLVALEEEFPTYLTIPAYAHYLVDISDELAIAA
ncbi:malate synthase A [Subtercola boreus]|uniref:Malate synthase n=1 Tax=Subtercola boreus TaxID=120213 RepID=A0A3E0VE94_9MICO|nr:malate synthase A [Subtercola boreus]RFA08244.1 malate synthase A [Subtercola boreus]TQL54862.1 malate synthase [Subtercola boreus]